MGKNMSLNNPKVLIVATSRKTRGGITSVVKAHEAGGQWKKYHCRWIETHRDGNALRKLFYLFSALAQSIFLMPFYDIVHIHVGLRTSVDRKLIFARIAKFYEKKIIVHFHPATEKHLFDNEFSTKIYALFSYSDLLIVLSHQWVNWINEAYPTNKFVFKVLYNPCPAVERGNMKKTNTILYAGMLSDRKGYDRLIHAFSKIAKQYPDWRIVFAGNGEIEKGQQLCIEQGIQEQVDFLGWIESIQKQTVFQKASIYCLPSWGEGFPMGVLDAMAYGIPIVTTPVGGIPELIKDGVNGFIFEPYDIEALSIKLSLLIESKIKRSEFVREADKLVNGLLNISTINAQLSAAYEELLSLKK